MNKIGRKVMAIVMIIALAFGIIFPEIFIIIVMEFGWKIIKFAIVYGLLSLACKIACGKSIIDLFFDK